MLLRMSPGPAFQRVPAEEVDFQGYFHSCIVSEAVSQWWKLYHNLPEHPGAGCYVLLADFGSARQEYYVNGRQVTGMYAFYFGKSEDGKGLTVRGQTYYQKSSATRCVNKLVAALWEHDVPVVHMCSQIPTSQGKGVLEAMMLSKFDFCTNYTSNGKYRVEGSGQMVFSQFCQLCSCVGQQKELEHSDFFATAVGEYDTELQADFLLQSREVAVRLQEAYSAIDFAEKRGAQPEQFQAQRSTLQQLQRTCLKQLTEHISAVQTCRDELLGDSACKNYLTDQLPLFVPSKSPSEAWLKSRQSATWAHEAYKMRKQLAEPLEEPAASSKPLVTTSQAGMDRELLQQERQAVTDARPVLLQNNFKTQKLYTKLVEDLKVKAKQAATLKAHMAQAAESSNNRELWKYLLSFKGLRGDRVERYAKEVVGRTPLDPLTYQPCLNKYQFMTYVAEQLRIEADMV